MKKQNVWYKVDEKNRIVIAEISNCKYDAIDKINKNFIKQVTSEVVVEAAWGSYLLMPYKFKSVARCCPEDEFDVNVGKRIACDRLVEKYERSLNKRMARFIVDMNKVLDDMSASMGGKEF